MQYINNAISLFLCPLHEETNVADILPGTCSFNLTQHDIMFVVIKSILGMLA